MGDNKLKATCNDCGFEVRAEFSQLDEMAVIYAQHQFERHILPTDNTLRREMVAMFESEKDVAVAREKLMAGPFMKVLREVHAKFSEAWDKSREAYETERRQAELVGAIKSIGKEVSDSIAASTVALATAVTKSPPKPVEKEIELKRDEYGKLTGATVKPKA